MPVWTSEQKEAIEKSGSNIIVSAGAGSGKTAVLSERVIYKIENGIHVNELLILTFTKAAAAEMKDRIRKKISKREEFKSELDLINSAYITTFDSFALSIVKRYHYLLNITNNINITDDSIVQICKNKILDETFEELYALEDEKFIKLIKERTIKNDKTIRTNILKLGNIIDGYIDPDAFYNYVLNKFYTEENINDLIDEYRELLKEKYKCVLMEYDNMSYYFDSDYLSKIDLSDLVNFDDFTFVSTFRLPSVPRNTEEEAKNAKNKLKLSIDELLDYKKYGDINKIKENILSTYDDVKTIIKIIKKYLNKLNKYKSEEGIYTFNDIASMAIKILSDNENVRNELKYSFKEIMIDEYQDTNDVQDKFISLIENNNVYMVGDIKQSIYKFRGSNPSIFMDKYNSYSKNINGYKIDLIKNFRSRSQVLNNINRMFELLMDDDIGGARYKESHEMIYGNTSYDNETFNDFNYDASILEYENETNEYSNNEIEIFTIAKDIKEKMSSNFMVFDKDTSKMRKATYNDFVIILDRSKYFDDYKKIFEYMGIPLTILKDDKLNVNNDILLIKNILDFIIRINDGDFNQEFKYDFISIARSFLYEYSDSLIFEIFANNSFKETSIFKDFSNIKSINSKICSTIYEEIIDISDFYNKLYKVGDYENVNARLETLYNLSNNLNELGYTIYDFRDYLNNIIEIGIDIKYSSYKDNSDSVKVMTIHKSKGLEYPVCYFADINHKFNISDMKDLVIADKKYGLILPATVEENNSIIKELYKNSYLKEEISEKIRLFYVALTRAREKIIIILPSMETFKYEKDENGVILSLLRKKFIKLSDLIYGIKEYLPEYFESINIEKLNLSKNYLYKKKIEELKSFDIDKIDVNEINIHNEVVDEEHFSKETHELLTIENRTNMRYGTHFHEVLELFDFKKKNYEVISEEFIVNKIKHMLMNPIFNDIENANIYKEYEFYYSESNVNYHGIIDLMIEHDDHIDIIDYKLKNTTDSNYIKQLNGYKKYIESISEKNVNLYLYSILDEKIVDIKV
mgnify:FL=1